MEGKFPATGFNYAGCIRAFFKFLFFCLPGCSATIKLSLRRTLQGSVRY